MFADLDPRYLKLLADGLYGWVRRNTPSDHRIVRNYDHPTLGQCAVAGWDWCGDLRLLVLLSDRPSSIRATSHFDRSTYGVAIAVHPTSGQVSVSAAMCGWLCQSDQLSTAVIDLPMSITDGPRRRPIQWTAEDRALDTMPGELPTPAEEMAERERYCARLQEIQARAFTGGKLVAWAEQKFAARKLAA